MKLVLRCLPNVLVLIVVAGPMARAGEERKSWNPGKAEAYLDERQNAWFAFSSADRGEGETRTSCVSCHTVTMALMKAGTSPQSVKQAQTFGLALGPYNRWSIPTFALATMPLSSRS